MERLIVSSCSDGYWINSEDMLTSYGWSEDEESAEAIVEACNNYEKLQQINKELIEALENCTSDLHAVDGFGVEALRKAQSILNKAKEITP